jgi:hypothetical protein
MQHQIKKIAMWKNRSVEGTTTLRIMTFSLMTFSLMTPSIKDLCVTLSITNAQHI